MVENKLLTKDEILEEELKPCPQCGSKADPDWGGVTEYNGIMDQSYSITCSDSKSIWCPVSVDISVNVTGKVNSRIVELTARNAWNALAYI